MKYDNLIGASTGFNELTYNWRDMALYALGVGAEAKDLIYIYEKDMKAIPTFGTLPLFTAVNNVPRRPDTLPACKIVANHLESIYGAPVTGLHMELEFEYHKPLYPIKGTMMYTETITNIYDWGDKGIVIKTNLPVYDEAGQLVCTSTSTSGYFAGGNFGGEKPPKSTVQIPDCAPDVTEESYMTPTQNALYRLSGDITAAHIDPDVAKEYGQPGAFMHGLCSYGFACRMAIQATIPGEPERMKRMSAQMRSVVLPDTHVRLEGWHVEEKKVYFRLMNLTNGKPILDKGVFEWE